MGYKIWPQNPFDTHTSDSLDTMNAAYAAATRSLLRSSAARAAVPRIASSAPKTRPAPSPFRIPKQNGVSCNRILRSPVELSSCAESMLPYHTVTASALLNSLLSGTPCCYDWSLQGCYDDL